MTTASTATYTSPVELEIAAQAATDDLLATQIVATGRQLLGLAAASDHTIAVAILAALPEDEVLAGVINLLLAGHDLCDQDVRTFVADLLREPRPAR